MPPNLIPITRDMVILRRAPHNGVKVLGSLSLIDSPAFNPSSNDHDGLSFYLGHLHTIQDVGTVLRGRHRKTKCFVLQILAGSLIDAGIVLEHDPKEASEHLPALPGHCLYRALTKELYDADYDKASDLRERLRFQKWEIVAEFPGEAAPPQNAPAHS